MKKIVFCIFTNISVFVPCLSNAQNTSVQYLSSKCAFEEYFYQSVYKKQVEYYYKNIHKKNSDTLNELFVNSTIVRERKIQLCLSKATFVKSVEMYDKDTLHTIGVIKVDTNIIAFSYDRRKDFSKSSIESQAYFEKFISEHPTKVLITESRKTGKKRWKILVSYQ